MSAPLTPEPGPQSGDETVERLNQPGTWMTIAAILMHRQMKYHIALGPEDAHAFHRSGLVVVAREGENNDGLLHIRLMPLKEAAALKAADVAERIKRGLRP